MIVNDIQGDLFASLEEGDALAHGANCYGVMGAGVAKPIRDMFPKNYYKYRIRCIKGSFLPGDCLSTSENGLFVYNLATQFKPGADARLEWIVKSVTQMGRSTEMLGRDKVKTVRLGCGIGGLTWDIVKPALEAIESDLILEVYYI